MSEVDFCNGKFSPWFSLKIFCWKGIAFKSLPYEKWLCSAGCSPMTERFPENLFASSVFSLAKRKRRNEKESSFLKDLAGIPKTGIFGFDSHSSRIVFLLHHLDKKLKMWDTFFLEKKKANPERTGSQRPYGWKWHFVVPNLSLSSRLLQATLPWLVSCCDSGPGPSPPPVLPVPPCCRSAPSSALPALELVPVPFPTALAAPHCYRSQPQLKGHSPSLGVTVPALRFTIPAHAAAACSIREGFFSPMHKWLDASWGCWQVSCWSRDGSTTAAPHSSSAEDTPRRGTVGLTDCSSDCFCKVGGWGEQRDQGKAGTPNVLGPQRKTLGNVKGQCCELFQGLSEQSHIHPIPLLSLTALLREQPPG